MIFQLSCEEVGGIFISTDGNEELLVDFLEQEQEVAVDGVY